MQDIIEVYGGKSLQGELIPQGAKNEALQVLCAVLLTPEMVTISNIPNILDVNKLIQLLSNMGVEVQKINNNTYTFKAENVNINYLNTQEYKLQAAALRGSVMIIGPLLARFKKAFIPKPGGDKIGRRRLDTHFNGFEKLGAKYKFEKDEYYIDASALKGANMLLDEPSVTGTANILMAAVFAEGETTIYNAACEPYVQQLCNMLVSMGAKISGIGSNLLKIEGVKYLKGTSHKMLADMIEVGSFIGLAAMTESDITIKNCDVAQLGIIPETFAKLGIKMNINGDDIHIPAQSNYEIQTFIDGSILTIYDHPWPGFTPDLISIILVVATQAKGTILIHQKMFESRLFFVDKLIDMGAQIVLCDPHRANVIGINKTYKLRGINMSSPDIRAGQALLIAALSAKGKSTISNVHQIDRGYQNIDVRLNAIGADIRRL
jgi:UDP-N-acetylglucosamine 1-carboxyvinyltransferase